ncbi:hypothetical protein, partial [Campylobacter sp.]|uniref:cache domain-containing protein n=1 Tax=Campylobacter sp. TaxID=205 RepID=UPI0026DC3C70
MIEDKRPSFGQPRLFSLPNEEFFGINISYPVFDGANQVIAVIGFIFRLDTLNKLLQDPIFDIYPNNLRGIIDRNGIYASHPNKELWGKPIYDFVNEESKQIVRDFMASPKTEMVSDKFTTSKGYVSYLAMKKFSVKDSDTFYMLLSVPIDEVTKDLRRVQFIVIASSLVMILLVSVPIFFIINRMIGRRLNILLDSIVAFFDFLNHKSKSISTIKIQGNDEFGQM